jgi:hypothetical protein
VRILSKMLKAKPIRIETLSSLALRSFACDSMTKLIHLIFSYLMPRIGVLGWQKDIPPRFLAPQQT